MDRDAAAAERVRLVEGQPPLDLDDEFSIDNEMVGGDIAQHGHHLGEVPAQGFAGLGPQFDGLARLKGQTAEPVSLGLVLPGSVFVGQT
jgi:hypothetical protein